MITIPLPARAPATRIPLIAPAGARVYDIAESARRVGLRLVHHPARGLEMVVVPKPGQIEVGPHA